MTIKDMAEMTADGIYYVVQSAYLKFPLMFRKRFGIGTGMKVSDEFPNPQVGIEENDEYVQLVYQFRKDDLERWHKSYIATKKAAKDAKDAIKEADKEE